MADPIFDEIKRLHHEMNKAFDNFFKRPSMRLLKEDSKNLIRRPLSMLLQPITDVIMKGNEIIARFDMPGIDKKDIDLKVTEDYLEVKAERRTSGRVSKKGIVSEESSFKSYYRIIPFPTKVSAGTARANYNNGVLEVRVKKSKEAKEKSHKVMIK